MMPNMMSLMNGFRGFMQNPTQAMLQNKFGIPQQFMNDPNGAIQYLLNSGKISQAQYNQIKQMADQLKNDPSFKQMFQTK